MLSNEICMAHWRAVVVMTFAILASSAVFSACSDEVDVDDLWKTMPHPDDVALNGSIQQIATALSEIVELPTGYGWAWEHVERHWDANYPLIELRHGLPLAQHGVPGDGGLPRELVDLIDDKSWNLSFEDFTRYAVQHNRVVLLYIGPDTRPEAYCIDVAFLVDVRRVTGGGRDEERWWVEGVTALEACPDD